MMSRDFYFKYPVVANLLTLIWMLIKWCFVAIIFMLAGYMTFPGWQGSVTWYPVLWILVGGAEILGTITISFILYAIAAERNRDRFENPWR